MICIKVMLGVFCIEWWVLNINVECGHPTDYTAQFIEEYFSFRNVRVLVVCPCSGGVELIKTLSSSSKFWLLVHHPCRASHLRANYYKFGVYLDVQCQNNKLFLEESSGHLLLNDSYLWLVRSPHRVKDVDLERLNLNVDSEVTWAEGGGERGRVYILHDLYKISYDSAVISTPAGSWSPDTGLHYTLRRYKYERRGDLRNLTLKAGIVLNEIPKNNLEHRLLSTEDREVETMARFNYAFFRDVQRKYKFSLDLEVLDSYGYRGIDGLFDGVVGRLANGSLDVGISAMFILGSRLDEVDFAGAMWEFRSAAHFLHPSTTAVVEALLLPFTAEVWICCAGIWALVMLVIHVLTWLESRQTPNETLESSCSATMISAISTITMQGYPESSKRIAWRVVFISAILLSVLQSNFYSASIVSSLLTPPQKTITSLRGLIDSNLAVGSLDFIHFRSYFNWTTDPLAIELYHRKIAPRGGGSAAFLPLCQGITKMKTELFALNAEAMSIYSLLDKELNDQDKCRLTEVTIMPQRRTYLSVQKSSPYRKMLTYGVNQAWERGLGSRQERTWRAKPPYCTGAGKHTSVQLETVLTAFFILYAGITASVIILAVEICVHRYTQKARRRCRVKWRPVKKNINLYTRSRNVFNRCPNI